MTVKSRIDGGTITLNISISIEDEDREEIGEYETEEEYVKRTAEGKVREEHGRIRGGPDITVKNIEEKEDSDDSMTVYHLLYHSRWDA
jgi:hypothetical protein